jgi:hypothetical protein
MAEAARQNQRRDDAIPDVFRTRRGQVQMVSCRLEVRTMERDRRHHAVIAARDAGILCLVRHRLGLAPGVVPLTRLEQQLSQGTSCLREPEHAACPVRDPLHPASGAERLLVAVEVPQHDRLVDLQQHPEVDQSRIVGDHVQRPVEQRQCRTGVAARTGQEDQHMERPGHRPRVTRFLRRRQRFAGQLARQ